jgi:hypothetical protein
MISFENSLTCINFFIMQKFLRLTISDAPTLIPVNNIVGIEVGANTKIKVYLGLVGHRATGASEVIGYEITATTASDAAKTKEQLVSFANAVDNALQQPWTKPVIDIDSALTYPATAIAQIEDEWSA